jgi:16S rRNA G527 N7-methylase RsmG
MDLTMYVQPTVDSQRVGNMDKYVALWTTQNPRLNLGSMRVTENYVYKIYIDIYIGILVKK